MPVVVVGHPVPARAAGRPGGRERSVGEDLTEALRSLLVQALNPAPMLPGCRRCRRRGSPPPRCSQEEAVHASDSKCPGCTRALQPFLVPTPSGAELELRRCTHCGGFWGAAAASRTPSAPPPGTSSNCGSTTVRNCVECRILMTPAMLPSRHRRRGVLGLPGHVPRCRGADAARGGSLAPSLFRAPASRGSADTPRPAAPPPVRAAPPPPPPGGSIPRPHSRAGAAPSRPAPPSTPRAPSSASSVESASPCVRGRRCATDWPVAPV